MIFMGPIQLRIFYNSVELPANLLRVLLMPSSRSLIKRICIVLVLCYQLILL